MKKYPICAQIFIQLKFDEYYQYITNNSCGFSKGLFATKHTPNDA